VKQLAADILLGPIIILATVIYIYGFNVENFFWFFLAGFMGVLPDGFSFLKVVFPQNVFLDHFFRFHSAIQETKIKVPVWLGIFFQLGLNLIAIYLLLKR